VAWNHLVVEGYCSYEKEVFQNVPCCNAKPGLTSILCLSDGNENIQCPYFGCVKARSSVILTDEHGNDASCTTFWSDEVDENEYIKKEKEWLEHWKMIIDNDKS